MTNHPLSSTDQPRSATDGTATAVQRLLDELRHAAAAGVSIPLSRECGAPGVVDAVNQLHAAMRKSDQLSADRERPAMLVLAERDRIAAMLNDLIVRDVFSLGLSIENLALRQPDLAGQLQLLVALSDDIIQRIRDLIFSGFPAPQVPVEPAQDVLLSRTGATGVRPPEN